MYQGTNNERGKRSKEGEYISTRNERKYKRGVR